MAYECVSFYAWLTFLLSSDLCIVLFNVFVAVDGSTNYIPTRHVVTVHCCNAWRPLENLLASYRERERCGRTIETATSTFGHSHVKAHSSHTYHILQPIMLTVNSSVNKMRAKIDEKVNEKMTNVSALNVLQ